MTTIARWLNSIKDKPKYKPYHWILGEFLKFQGIPCNEVDEYLDLIDYRTIDLNDIEGFIGELIKQRKSPYTINMFISSLWSYSSWLVGRNPLDGRVLRFREVVREKFKFIDTPGGSTVGALDEHQLRRLLELIDDPLVYSATIVHFYTGARPIELAREFVFDRIDDVSYWLSDYYSGPILDLKNRLIGIVTAKGTRTRKMANRVLPIHKAILKEFKYYFENVDVVLRYCRPEEWYTKHIKKKKYRDEIFGNSRLRLTAYSARKTFKTYMERIGIDDYMIRYWMGHKAEVPDRYRDKSILLRDLEDQVVKKHIIMKIL